MYQAPDFSSTPWLTPSSSTSPSREMPLPYRMSNSALRNGGATLFLTIFTPVSEPITPSPLLIEPMRRMSTRTSADDLNALPPVVGFVLPYMTPRLMPD